MKKIAASLFRALGKMTLELLKKCFIAVSSPPSQQRSLKGTRNVVKTGSASVSDSRASKGAARIKKAFGEERSDFVVASKGCITRILPDDLDGSRHQRFLVELENGHTILLSHNIDCARPVVNANPGDLISFKGEYEWSLDGGVVHWTHEDKKDWHEDGFIEHNGKRYD